MAKSMASYSLETRIWWENKEEKNLGEAFGV